MPINIAIAREITPGEERVAMVPAIAKNFTAKGCQILLEHDAGSKSFFNDGAYANTTILNSAKELYAQGDVVIKIQPPTNDEIKQMKNGGMKVGGGEKLFLIYLELLFE